LKAWENLGINRISIWVQTLNEKSLRKIWRKDKGNIFNALDLIKKPKNISLDFIIWLPFVEKWEVKKDIETILDKYDFINHISVYMLEWYKSSLKEKEFLEEYLEVKDFLEKEGFKRYELSNFAKKWFECRHNKWYWQHKNYLGFWASAHGFVWKTRFSNYDKLIEYYKNIGIWRFQKSEKLSEKDLFLEKMMFDLRTTGIWKKDALKLNKEKIDEFVKNKYLKWWNNKLKLADKWILVLDYILGEIL
jgi:oxygen-independent coproporphyrinogen-3 oxidase